MRVVVALYDKSGQSSDSVVAEDHYQPCSNSEFGYMLFLGSRVCGMPGMKARLLYKFFVAALQRSQLGLTAMCGKKHYFYL